MVSVGSVNLSVSKWAGLLGWWRSCCWDCDFRWNSESVWCLTLQTLPDLRTVFSLVWGLHHKDQYWTNCIVTVFVTLLWSFLNYILEMKWQKTAWIKDLIFLEDPQRPSQVEVPVVPALSLLLTEWVFVGHRWLTGCNQSEALSDSWWDLRWEKASCWMNNNEQGWVGPGHCAAGWSLDFNLSLSGSLMCSLDAADNSSLFRPQDFSCSEGSSTVLLLFAVVTRQNGLQVQAGALLRPGPMDQVLISFLIILSPLLSFPELLEVSEFR